MKENFYSQIKKNEISSWFLIVFFIIFTILIGAIIGYISGDFIFFIILFSIISIISVIFQYNVGDKIILKSYNAKPANKKEHLRLINVVEGLAIAAGIPTPKAYVINDDSPNAFATGKDPNHASVVVTTGLLKIMNKQELEGVISHELSHIKNHDIKFMMLTSVLLGLIIMISRIFLRSLWFRGRDREGGSIYLILFLIGITLAILSPIFAKMIQLAISRKREYLADASGAKLTRYPKGLANALKKIKEYNKPLKHADTATAHLFIANPFSKKSFNNLFSTHPPIEERIKRLEAM